MAKAKAKKEEKAEEPKEGIKEELGEVIGEVSNYFKNVKAAAIKLVAGLKVGDSIRIKGGEKDVEMKVDSMEVNRESIDSAKKGDEIGLLVPEDVHKGYKVHKVWNYSDEIIVIIFI